jgi:glutaredoxin
MKKGRFILLALLVAGFLCPAALRAAGPVDVYLFYGDGCPHCERAEAFLEGAHGGGDLLRVHRFEVFNSAENQELMLRAGQTVGVTPTGVPFVIIGSEPFVGYSESTSPAAMRSAIDRCRAAPCADPVAALLGAGATVHAPPTAEAEPPAPDAAAPPGDDPAALPAALSASGAAEPPAGLPPSAQGAPSVQVPVWGSLSASSVSLPVLTVLLGALDGFNPCAMWVLLFIISMLLGMPDRRRMWVLGGAFILVSALVYYVFMAAWLNIVLFFGMMFWVRLAVALVALGGGAYSVSRFFADRGDGGCSVVGDERRAHLRAGRAGFWTALVLVRARRRRWPGDLGEPDRAGVLGRPSGGLHAGPVAARPADGGLLRLSRPV